MSGYRRDIVLSCYRVIVTVMMLRSDELSVGSDEKLREEDVYRLRIEAPSMGPSPVYFIFNLSFLILAQ